MPRATHHDASRFNDGKRSRSALLAVIVAAHAAIILWLLTRPPTTAPRRPDVTSLALIAPSVDHPRPTSQPAARRATREHVRKPSPLRDRPVPPAAAAPPSASPASASGCNLTTAVGAAIEQDPAAMAELAMLPPGIRTEADAVMIWNGEWRALSVPTVADAAVPATSPAPGASELRRTIEALATAAPPACLAALVPGPLFIPVREVGRTTTLVIGSGAWRWADLLIPQATCVASAVGTCPSVPLAAPIIP
ncbi:MAG: hypothetical protein ABIR77_02245 [Sphingomicrobium sp.]